MERDYCINLLTESGIELGSGGIIRFGRVVEIAREAKVFLESGQLDEFYEFLLGEEVNDLSVEHRRILLTTTLSEAPPSRTIIGELCNIEYMRAPSRKEAENAYGKNLFR